MHAHVVVLGAGYAGLPAARLIAERCGAATTLVNASALFVERVRLHQVAAGQRVRQRSMAELLVYSPTMEQQLRWNMTSNDGTPLRMAFSPDSRRLIETAVNEFGGIDVLICNAGISMRAIFDDVDLSVLHRLMDVNFWGTVYCTKYALPYLQKSHGSLVGISSVAGLHGLPGRTGYSASKFAMTGFLETVRIENLKKGLHVMVACPGFTASNVRFSALVADGSQQGSTPREEGKMMTPEQVAKIVAKGIAKRKRLCLMEIEGRATHFAKKFAPAFLDKMFYLVMSREPDSPFK